MRRGKCICRSTTTSSPILHGSRPPIQRLVGQLYGKTTNSKRLRHSHPKSTPRPPHLPCLWHQHIHNILINYEGFQCCTHEPCLYFKRDEKAKPEDSPEVYIKRTANDGFVLVLRHVDDFAISGSSTEECINKVR